MTASTIHNTDFQSPRRHPVNPLKRLYALLYIWQARAEQRYSLTEIEDRLLADVGITRAEADREAAKPFWRA